jgi:hypothetical protein
VCVVCVCVTWDRQVEHKVGGGALAQVTVKHSNGHKPQHTSDLGALQRSKAAVALEGEPREYVEEGLHSRSPVQTPDSILHII